MTAIQVATHPDFGCHPHQDNPTAIHVVGSGGLRSAAGKEGDREGVANAHTTSRPKGAGGADGEVCAGKDGPPAPYGLQ